VRILAIGAHPDDLEIYAWGALSAWAAMGADLTLAVATDGAAGGTGDPAALREMRAAEARAAAAALGVEPRFLGFPDGALLAEAAAPAIKALAVQVQADLIVTHDPNDYHHDHRALAAAVAQGAGFSFPVLWMDTLNGTGFDPTHWVDTTAYHAAKGAAIRCHASQDPERFVAMADRLAAFRAGQANGTSDARAEAFRFAPRFPFADIRALLPPSPPLRRVIARGPQAGGPGQGQSA
jgi:N-acetylglucosamine malate deacetylase 1